jgi:hypothetical protein
VPGLFAIEFGLLLCKEFVAPLVAERRKIEEGPACRSAAATIQLSTAALSLLIRKVTADKALEGIKGEGGKVMKTSLDHTKEATLRRP